MNMAMETGMGTAIDNGGGTYDFNPTMEYFFPDGIICFHKPTQECCMHSVCIYTTTIRFVMFFAAGVQLLLKLEGVQKVNS